MYFGPKFGATAEVADPPFGVVGGVDTRNNILDGSQRLLTVRGKCEWGGLKEEYILYGRAFWRHLANTVERLYVAAMSNLRLPPWVATRPLPK